MATDAVSATIINQTLASRLGLEDPVGEWIEGFYDGQRRQIIGVVEIYILPQCMNMQDLWLSL